MVERYRRGKGKRKLLGSHQKCWIWGRHVVTETLSAGRWKPLEVCLADDIPPEEREVLARDAQTAGVPVRTAPSQRLSQLCHSSEHQGYLAKMPEFPYAEPHDILNAAPPCPLFVLLDGLQDPYNLGGIIRSAEVLGVDGLFLKKQGQVGVTSLVTRTSSGAVNHLPIARCDDLVGIAEELKSRGIVMVATGSDAGLPVYDGNLSGPVAVVIGNEGEGLSEELLHHCDRHLTIPQQGRVGSLNAAVAAGIVFYEVRRQRGVSERGETA